MISIISLLNFTDKIIYNDHDDHDDVIQKNEKDEEE